MNLKIISTCYNAEKYIALYLQSLLKQTHTDFKVMLIDDKSTDSTFEIIKKTVGGDSRFIIKQNEVNLKAVANYVNHIPLLCDNDDDVIVSIDGDDWLYCNDALEYINNIYTHDKNLKLTYGQYVCASDLTNNKIISGCSKPIDKLDDIVKPGFNMSHIKTFKFGVFKQIKDEWLRRWDKKYIQRAWDQPLMLPMAFISGKESIKCVDKILYVYNNLNPISEWRLNESEQMREDAYTRDLCRAIFIK
jgi:glycosyltransferase involved in cell wall biosynthesis